MTGWKTKTAGIGNIVGGIGLIAIAFSEEKINFEKIAGGWAMIMFGLGFFGFGHKIEKATIAIIKQNKEAL